MSFVWLTQRFKQFQWLGKMEKYGDFMESSRFQLYVKEDGSLALGAAVCHLGPYLAAARGAAPASSPLSRLAWVSE